MPTRQIDGPTIGFQHLVTVTNTDSAVRRMLLSAMPETLLMSNLSQLSPSVVSDVTPEPCAADDEPAVLRPNVDSPTSELQSAMEVSNNDASFLCSCYNTDHFQDLSLAPADDRSVSPVVHGHSGGGVPGDSLACDNSLDHALPTAHSSEVDGDCSDVSERTPANPAQEGTLPNVLSPSAPMNLFSPTSGHETVVSPSAASSYAEAAEALGQGITADSDTPSPVIPSATADSVASDVHEEQQLNDAPVESGGSAR